MATQQPTQSSTQNVGPTSGNAKQVHGPLGQRDDRYHNYLIDAGMKIRSRTGSRAPRSKRTTPTASGAATPARDHSTHRPGVGSRTATGHHDHEYHSFLIDAGAKLREMASHHGSRRHTPAHSPVHTPARALSPVRGVSDEQLQQERAKVEVSQPHRSIFHGRLGWSF
ncbi:hypothetical protein EJ03DRAFT_11329 [Teratosphaeria nubilosa]|uniref:Uncharacterized protein n=1 Tax=Teratosphaeria nubilosa TaxID=161662 RepID=A0A6G1LHM6_9PEZI|nr:hypothetical protein EJ03DRAFT_11329 [Teratosphaeria nubilosa]